MGVDAKMVLPYNPACRRRETPWRFPLTTITERADRLPGNRKQYLVPERDNESDALADALTLAGIGSVL